MPVFIILGMVMQFCVKGKAANNNNNNNVIMISCHFT